MTEPESRAIAASIVAALHSKGQVVREITIEPQGMSLCVRAELNGPVVECVLPPGYFSTARVADALILATGRCALDS